MRVKQIILVKFNRVTLTQKWITLMKITLNGDVLHVGGLTELGVANARTFLTETDTHMTNGVKTIEIDMGTTSFVDSVGLGALITLHRAAIKQHCEVVRLINPTPSVRLLIEMTQMHRLFEIKDQ